MAARKKAPTKTKAATDIAVAAPDSKALMNAAAQLEKELESVDSSLGEESGFNIQITMKKTFRIPDMGETADPISVVILDWVTTRSLYATAYNPNDYQPPSCFAVNAPTSEGGVVRGMSPVEDSPDKQADSCDECPMNVFGTGRNGTSKACTERRVLAVALNPDDPESPIATIKVSPTALKRFDGYVKLLKSKRLHPMSVVTTIGFDEHMEHSSLVFSMAGANPNVSAFLARRMEATGKLRTTPDFTAAAAPRPRASTAARAPRGRRIAR